MLLPVVNTRLKGRIYGAGLNQKKFAYALGMSEPYVSNVINGYKRPSLAFIQKASALLATEAAEIFPELAEDKMNVNVGVFAGGICIET